MAKFSCAEHWKFFSEFVDFETRAGGPDPHLTLAAHMSRNASLQERFWRAGCYISVYNAPFGEAIWRHWSWERYQREPELLLPWLQDNWKKIVTRRERRCVRRPEWMHQYFVSYAKMAENLPTFLAKLDNLTPYERYDRLWDEVLTVSRLGRYVALKLLEFYKVACEVDAELPDLRPKGGWSPRQTLGDLWPEDARVALRDDSPELLKLANHLTDLTQAKLASDFGLHLDKFRLQVLLCDYKQSWKGRRQYPGKSIDSELLYVRQAEELWGHRSEIWDARQVLFPRHQLGELQGWLGPREEPANVLADHKYTWSDELYDYTQTTDFTTPVKRKPSTGAPKSDRLHAIVDGKLYQSSNWNKLTVEARKELVATHGITGVVSVWAGQQDLSESVAWYWHVPFADGKNIPATLDEIVHEIYSRISKGECIVVMCHAGRNRSALVTALVTRLLLNCDGKRAMEWVRERRPRSLANEHFERYLSRKGAPLFAALLR